jgi:uncharacterized protein (TIGR02117 family)
MRILRNQWYLLAVISLSSCGTLSRGIGSKVLTEGESKNLIHVASHGWHTGIILQPEHLNRHVPSLVERFPQADFYEVGWGDAGFYQANKITLKISLNAVFLPSDTVVHLVGFEGDPVEYFSTSDVKEVRLSDEGMESLGRFVASSFAKDCAGQSQKLGPGLYGDSQFYRGEGRYHLFNGCNKWTAKALRSGGMEINPLLKITSASVMDEIGEPIRRVKRGPMIGR